MTVRTIDEIFRDFVTDGVPATGPFNPHKPDIRDTLKSLTEGSENFPDNRVIRLNNADEGTANNIVVTASVAIPAAAYQVLYILNVTQENTGPVTVSGAINRDLVTNINQPIVPSYLIPGMALLCIDTGTALRLLSYGDAEAILAAAEDAAARAEAAAAGLNLPSAGAGDKGKALLVNSDASGYTLGFVEITVETRADLKALPVFFKSARLTEAGREGSFVLRTGTPAKADSMEGVVVVSNTNGYYWERVFSGPVDVRWFGARLDGSFDDTLNVQAALDYHGHARIPFTTAGVILSGLNVKTGYILEGGQGIYTGSVSNATAKEKVTVRYSGASAINITSWTFGANATVRGFYFIGTGSATGAGIIFKTSVQPIMGVTLEDLDFNDCYGAIVDEVHATNWTQMIYVRRVACYFIRNTQVLLRRSQGFIQYEDVRIDYVSQTGPITWDGARFEEIGGLELTRFDVVGLGNDTTFRNAAYGLVVRGVTLRSSVWMDRVLVDSLNTNGILIDGIFNVMGQNVSAGLIYGASITLNNCDFIDLTSPVIYGAKNLASAPASVQGLRLSGCTSGTISNLRVRDVKGIGYVLNNSQHIKLNGGVIRDNAAQGILEAGTSNFNLNNGVSVVANVGSLVQVGAQSATTNWIPAGGTFTASTVGAASIA